ncbi:MAG: NADH-quinone oxidoreductase subunit L [Nitrospirota bacterium]
MLDFLWIVPALPLAGFALLAVWGPLMPRRAVSAVGAGSVGLAAIAAAACGLGFAGLGPGAKGFTLVLWQWIDVGGFSPRVALYLDGLSVVMTLVVSWVGFLILVYSAEYMEEEDYSRFFAYMDLFVASMLILVLADNLTFLYLGWEGVGLCSYLLIGYWYKDPANGWAAQKAFIVTRVGDAALAVGIFLIFHALGTTTIQELMGVAQKQWATGSGAASLAAWLLLLGALGKSAQLPLQTWLPDAMAGPTPVSALIHAATMVTAGVYLIARTHVIFTLAPSVQLAVAVIGALTLLLAGMSALAQRDIKRALAYSTMSQIGYMFLALGVGAWAAAIFHFMTHAFFKALLFLSAGVVIHALKHERDMFRMGGLRRKLPLAFWTFLVGASSLSALPLITAGFYSKDLIISDALFSTDGGPWLWGAGLAGALITSVYSFRMVFLVFFGQARGRVVYRPGLRMSVPLLALATLSIAGGWINVPHALTGAAGVLPALQERTLPVPRILIEFVTSATSLLGIYLAFYFYVLRPDSVRSLARTGPGGGLRALLHGGWGFDRLYDALLVRPFLFVARVNKDDFVDLFYTGAAWYNGVVHGWLSATQSGKVRWYVTGMAFGAILVLGMMMVFA